MAENTHRTDETPYVDPRDGGHVPHEPARDPAGTPVAEAAPIHARSVAADEVIEGQHRAADPAEAVDPDRHYADHTMSTPSGSDRAAIETPDSPRSRKLLIGAVVAVAVILLLMFLIPEAADAAILAAEAP